MCLFQVPGGGAVEAALAHRLNEKSKAIQGVGQWPYRALAEALKVIPKTLMQVGTDVVCRHDSRHFTFAR